MQKITLSRRVYKEIMDLKVKKNIFVYFIENEVFIQDIYHIAPSDELEIEYIDVDERWWNAPLFAVISSMEEIMDSLIVRDGYVRYILLDVAYIFVLQWLSRNMYAEDDKRFNYTFNKLEETRATLKECVNSGSF